MQLASHDEELPGLGPGPVCCEDMAVSGSSSDTAVLLDGASPTGKETSFGDARLEPQSRDTASLKQDVAPFSASWSPVQGPVATAPDMGPAVSRQPPLLSRPFCTVTTPRALASGGEASVHAPATTTKVTCFTVHKRIPSTFPRFVFHYPLFTYRLHVYVSKIGSFLRVF